MNRQQSGFTLIELVVVIVLLGILAATALPRFINLSTDARLASLDGLVGGMRSATALVQARYFATGDNTATSVAMADGQAVTVVAGAAGGQPTADAAGIEKALKSFDGFTPTYAAGVATFTLATNCTVTYTEASAVAARGATSGC